MTTASRNDPREYTSAARAKFAERFYQSIPADLPQTERDRRAAAARKLYFARLSQRSAKARSKKKAARAIVSPRTAASEVRGASADPTS